MPLWRLILLALLVTTGPPVVAQTVLDRTDPTQSEADMEPAERPQQANPVINAPPQSAPDRQLESGGRIAVSSIIISGNEALPDSEFVDLIEHFTAQPLSQADLTVLADAVAQRARERGYVFASAIIPQQSLNLGVLRIELDEGKVDTIRIEGADDPAIRRQLAPLVDGGPVTKDELERRILLANDISGARIFDASFEREGALGVLLVRTRRSRASASVALSNNGSQPVGPVRARIHVDLNGVLDGADEVDLTVGTTPFQPDELQFVRGSYRIVVDADGLELGTHISYSATDPGAFLSDRDINGEFWRVGVDAQYPLLRRRALSVWVIGEFEVTNLKQMEAGAVVRHDRVPTVRLGIYSRGRFAGGYFRGRVMASRGLDILSATQSGDPLASRSDASAQFTSLYGWAAWNRSLIDSFSLALGVRAQLAAEPLLATEDIGLGGPSFLRGYNFNERTGDQGIMGYGELRYNWRGEGFWMPRGQVYVFADGGVVSNLEGGFGGGSLASAGGGLRLDLTRDLDLGLEVAVPLTGERLDSDSDDPLFNLRVQQTF